MMLQLCIGVEDGGRGGHSPPSLSLEINSGKFEIIRALNPSFLSSLIEHKLIILYYCHFGNLSAILGEDPFSFWEHVENIFVLNIQANLSCFPSCFAFLRRCNCGCSFRIRSYLIKHKRICFPTEVCRLCWWINKQTIFGQKQWSILACTIFNTAV